MELSQGAEDLEEATDWEEATDLEEVTIVDEEADLEEVTAPEVLDPAGAELVPVEREGATLETWELWEREDAALEIWEL
jgi:hypothetical protein